MLNTKPIGASQVEYLAQLVYELLDAHQDTARLVGEIGADREFGFDPGWDAHLDYLRGLQRIGREALAQLGG